jgi:hypothetical protein
MASRRLLKPKELTMSSNERPLSLEASRLMHDAAQTRLNLQDIEQRCRNMAEIAREREEAKVIQLPLWHEGRRGSPNSFLRSALFAAVQGKDRKYFKDEAVFSQQGYTVKFTGERLNQEDMTVWLALVDLARKHPLGNECGFTAYGILKHMGLKDGGRERERLRLGIERMTACMVKIETGRFTYGGSLIDDFAIDEQTKYFRITLNKKLVNIFGEDDWTAISWEQRKQLRSKPLAQKLHEYYSSHAVPKLVTVEFLYNITGSTNKDKHSFKRQVKAALEALVKIGFLENSPSIDGKSGLVTVKRVHKAPASRKYLGS